MTLYKYQRRAVKKMLALGARGLLSMEMGTGKSLVAITMARHLPDCRKILVVAPLSAAGVWRREVRKWAPGARTMTCTQGSIARRALKLLRLAHRKASNRVFVIVGYESFWREPLRKAIINYQPDMIIYDEGHRLKGRGTRQSRFAHTLTSKHILALTGTPFPNGPEDAFSLFKAIDPSVFGTRWVDFEDRYIIRGGFQRYQIIGYRNLPEFEQRIADHSFRITKAEALDLPPQVDVEIPVTLSKKARAIYDKLSKEAIAEIEAFDGSQGIALSRIVLTNIIRLQQVASGFVRVEDGRILDFDTSKLDMLSDLLRDALDAAGRVVVFCRFRHDVDAVSAVARRLIGDHVYRIDGRVDPRDREAQLAWFRTFEPAVLVGQMQVASLSIDLTCAHVGIFFSRDYSLLNFDQARGRLHRHGQKQKVTYYHLVADQTIDENIYQALLKKDKLQRSLLDARRAKEFFS